VTRNTAKAALVAGATKVRRQLVLRNELADHALQVITIRVKAFCERRVPLAADTPASAPRHPLSCSARANSCSTRSWNGLPYARYVFSLQCHIIPTSLLQSWPYIPSREEGSMDGSRPHPTSACFRTSPSRLPTAFTPRASASSTAQAWRSIRSSSPSFRATLLREPSTAPIASFQYHLGTITALI
jgi:hypothetical protein